MDKEEKRIAIEGVIYLCRCAVSSSVPEADKVKRYNLEHLYNVACHHMIASMVGMTLRDAGIKDPIFDRAIAASQWKTIILNEEKCRVFEALDKAKIWHMALKGTIIRDWYPKFGMRESADCDILFDKTREEDVKAIMVDLGYTIESYGKGHHDVYLREPVTNMQMHVELFGTGFDKRLNDYYENVYERLEGERYEKSFKPEDFYIYVLAHNHNDYSRGGCGIRSLLDTYVILKRFDFEWDYIRRETEKLGIQKFEEENRSLALHLFDDEELTDADKSRLEYMVSAGVYGTIENAVQNRVKNNGGGLSGRIRYLLERMILPMDVVEHSFPVFYKHKLLIPFLPLYRLYRGITSNRHKLKAELRALKTEQQNISS
nr:nucleotidyltransferase family protein [Clostridia bacterium]